MFATVVAKVAFQNQNCLHLDFFSWSVKQTQKYGLNFYKVIIQKWLLICFLDLFSRRPLAVH